MIRFRPLPGLTIVSLVAVAILVGLGAWQMERLHWKLALIAQITHAMQSKPVPLGDGGRLRDEPQTDYLHVTVRGRFDNAKESYLYTTGPGGAPVYHVIVPLTADNGAVYLVDRGIVPLDRKNPATRAAGIARGETSVTGIWRWPDAPGPFTPPPDLSQRLWYFKDVAGIARADGVKLWQTGLIEADAAPNPGGWPLGGQSVVNLRNEHLQYAVTWFGLAWALVCMYIAYHWSQGRLDIVWRGKRLGRAR